MDDQTPFPDVEGYWAVRFVVPMKAVEYVDAAFEEVGVSISTFEADAEGVNWQVEVLCEMELLGEEIESRLSVMAALAKCAAPDFKLDYVKQRDWVSEVQKSFPPLSAGRFYIYGSHHEEGPPADRTSILIDAGAAFGSGEHETTSTCLLALDALAEEGCDFKSMLDMGCGSGILAIAMAKTWDAPVIAADIDPIAVDVTAHNCELNDVAGKVLHYVSDGYAHRQIAVNAPYDLIVANILARPLVELAPDLAEHLAEGGKVVLSGLLERQEAEVIAAHEACGLRFIRRFPQKGWHTLLLEGV